VTKNIRALVELKKNLNPKDHLRKHNLETYLYDMGWNEYTCDPININVIPVF
jgi:hypothetical protein